MADDLTSTELLVDSTVRIISYYENGEMGYGTGFFYQLFDTKEDGLLFGTIVTNKHVIEGATSGELVINKKNQDGSRGENYTFNVQDFHKGWIYHPEKDIDLAMFPLGSMIHDLWEKKGISVHYAFLHKDLFPTENDIKEFKAIEDVIMIGYPNGIWDEANNTPIIRKGITATPAYYNYENKPELVIDIASFPGSSGSPVFVYNDFYYTGKDEKILYDGGRLLFLGILHSGFLQDLEGKIEAKTIPTSEKRVSVRSKLPINLGIIVKSEKLMDFERIIKVKE